jgi:hypothetical protein
VREEERWGKEGKREHEEETSGWGHEKRTKREKGEKTY